MGYLTSETTDCKMVIWGRGREFRLNGVWFDRYMDKLQYASMRTLWTQPMSPLEAWRQNPNFGNLGKSGQKCVRWPLPSPCYTKVSQGCHRCAHTLLPWMIKNKRLTPCFWFFCSKKNPTNLRVLHPTNVDIKNDLNRRKSENLSNPTEIETKIQISQSFVGVYDFHMGSRIL